MENEKLKNVLMSIGDSRITDLMDKDIFGILDKFGDIQSSQEKLIELVIDINTPYGLLRNKKKRKIILRNLDAQDCIELLEIIGIKNTQIDSPWEKLCQTNFYKNSKNEKILLEYFDVEKPVEKETDMPDSPMIVEPEYALFDYQKKALTRTIEKLKKDQRCLLHMPTGSGKTRVAMNAVARYLKERENSVIIWLAYNKELCEQAAEEFIKAWGMLGDRKINLVRFYGNEYEWKDISDGLIIAGLSKIWEFSKKEITALANLAPKVSLIVFDEAHSAIAETYLDIINEILILNESSSLLGLSATPGRTWEWSEEDEKLAKLFDQNKVSLNMRNYDSPIKYLIDHGYLANPIFNPLNIEKNLLTTYDLHRIQENFEIPTYVLSKLEKDDFRNAKIILKVMDLIKKDHSRILLFAISVDHSNTLASILQYYNYNAHSITSQTDDYTRSQIIENFKEEGGEPMILCNYGVLTTGFDAPKTSAGIITRPTKSIVLYSQMIGRITRGPKVGGTQEAEIWTVVDTNLPGFGNLVEAFENWEDVW